MISNIQVITTPTADTPETTLLLHLDNKRYLIGRIGEGIQRASIQMGMSTRKMSDIFLTGKTEWATTGGLIGMVLTMADSRANAEFEKSKRGHSRKGSNNGNGFVEEENRLRISGAPNLNHTIACARRFVFRKGMPIYAHEYTEQTPNKSEDGTWKPSWADEKIKVWAMPITPGTVKDPNASRSSPELPCSPRKRSFDDFSGATNGQSQIGEVESEMDEKTRHQELRKAVVANMFSSSWHLDTLVPKRLSEVEQPATIFYKDPITKKIEPYTGPMPNGTDDIPDINVLIRTPWPAALISSLPPTEPSEEALSYIIKTHPQRGKFDPQKAKALLVPKGEKWAQLSKGKDVQSDDGRTVTPDMVLGETRKGKGVVVIDLPSCSHVEALVSRPEWRSVDVMDGVEAFFWILAPGVGSNPTLRAFMEEMKQHKHIVSSTDYCPNGVAMVDAAAAQVRMREIDTQRYPATVCDKTTLPQTKAPPQEHEAQPLPSFARAAQPGQILQLIPKVELQGHAIQSVFDAEAPLQGYPPVVHQLAQEAREAVAADRANLNGWKDKIPSPDADITTLGTGSCLPSKYRNVSATLLRVPGYGNYLFDCGENTLGQLKRVFPADELNQIFQDLRMIWISHLHADHHLGTVNVIKAWYAAVHGSNPDTSYPFTRNSCDPVALMKNKKRLAVVSHVAMLNYLQEYSQVEDYGISRIAPLAMGPGRASLTWVTSTDATHGWGTYSVLQPETYPDLLGLSDIQAVTVKHCLGAMAVSLTFPNAFKVSYSGDCRPSNKFVEIGKDTTVLIHEATFDDNLRGEAVAKKHSTTREALGVGEAMGAKAVVLTHFSQRYQKIPVIETIDEAGREAEMAEERDVVLEDAESDDDVNMDAGVETHTLDPEPAEPTITSAMQPPADAPISDGPAAAQQTTSAAKSTVQTTIRLKSKDMKVCVAFDYMKVKVGEIAEMEKFTPALVRLFEELEWEKEREKAKAREVMEAAGRGEKTEKQKLEAYQQRQKQKQSPKKSKEQGMEQKEKAEVEATQ